MTIATVALYGAKAALSLSVAIGTRKHLRKHRETGKTAVKTSVGAPVAQMLSADSEGMEGTYCAMTFLSRPEGFIERRRGTCIALLGGVRLLSRETLRQAE